MSPKQRVVQIIRKYFKDKPVLKAYLFGSYARSEHTPDSDIDILVELDRSQPVGLEFIQMKLDLGRLLSSPIDLVTQQSLSKHIRPYIDQDKTLIYEKKNL